MTQDYLSLPDSEAATLISTRMREWNQTERLRYSQIGLMCLEVQKRRLWNYVDDGGIPCRSFARWLKVCAPYSYSTAYAALADVEELQDVPADDLAQIPQSNFFTFKQLSTAIRREPSVIAAAKTQRTEAFVDTIRKDFPDQHISRRKSFHLNPTEEQKAEIDEAFELAIRRGDARTKEEAVFGWAVNYKQECQDNTVEEMTNETEVVQ
jgi:hypothetical protein